MTELAHLDLIRFLDFYLMLTFLAGTVRRIGQYLSIGRLVVGVPSRWPRLLELVKQYRMIFLTWSTVLPALLWLALSVVQLIASREVWPQARLTVGELEEHGWALALVLPVALLTFALDLYGILFVGTFDHKQMEQYFDQAEYWLRSKTATVVKVFTLGFVNPRRMVAEEVQKALVSASQLLNTTLWWVSVQISLRVAFGLSLWLTWALTKA
ncbi:MAG: hypothetical protein L0Z62_08840 [Gemmataceae bacterium]|nr:hypothetical protein [Gemmataceae bacterium]